MPTVQEIVETMGEMGSVDGAVDVVDQVIVKSAEAAVGEFLVALQSRVGIPAAALLPLIVAVVTITALVIVQHLWAYLLRLLSGDGAAGSSSSGHTVLITGTCGSGKTALFQTLRSGTPYLTTVTSMATNDAMFHVEGPTKRNGVVRRKLRVVDLPGHPKLVSRMDEHLPSAKAIVFVIDAVDFTSNRREVSERLRDLLANPLLQKKKRNFPVLVACNKSEKITANPVEYIAKRLEKEIEALREAAAGALQDTAGGGGARDVGIRGKPFTFADSKCDVTFSAVSVAENDLDELKSFLVVK